MDGLMTPWTGKSKYKYCDFKTDIEHSRTGIAFHDCSNRGSNCSIALPPHKPHATPRIRPRNTG